MRKLYSYFVYPTTVTYQGKTYKDPTDYHDVSSELSNVRIRYRYGSGATEKFLVIIPPDATQDDSKPVLYESDEAAVAVDGVIRVRVL